MQDRIYKYRLGLECHLHWSDAHAHTLIFIDIDSFQIAARSSTVDAPQIRSVHTNRQRMPPSARAGLATRTRVLTPMSSVQVLNQSYLSPTAHFLSRHAFLDTCQVRNGGCNENALCGHHPTSNIVTCTCKTGYINIGSNSTVTCLGKNLS
jgi:hypothetical protein